MVTFDTFDFDHCGESLHVEYIAPDVVYVQGTSGRRKPFNEAEFVATFGATPAEIAGREVTCLMQ